jgi:dipeptide/tripeptide permease
MAGFTYEQVEEVRMVVRMLPIFLTTIFYWTIYSQVRAASDSSLPNAPLHCLSLP